MNQTSEDRKISCQNCGFMDSGNYCSECGSELAPHTHNSILHFVDSFLKIGEIKSYVIMFFTILSSPTKNIVAYYEEKNAKKAYEFLGYSAAFYFLIALSKIWVIEGHDLIVDMIYTLQFVITLSISIPICYKLSIKKSPYNRTFNDFLIISSLYVGFNIVLISIATYIQLINLLLGTLAILLISIPMIIYTFRVLEYFWGLTKGKMLLYLIVSSFTGGTLGTLFLIICVNIFNKS